MRREDDSGCSITEWIQHAAEGDEVAQRVLWNRYFERLLPIARSKLPDRNRRVNDEEDVVVQAFEALFRALRESGTDGPADREDLWRLILALADRKALDHLRYLRREKRGRGEVRGHSAFGKNADEMAMGIASIPTPTSEFAQQVNVACEDLLDILKPEHRKIALWKLEGRSNADIAKLLGCVEETVRRKILVIRSSWQNDVTS